jgi:predicted nuclease with TOPRIM domain
MSAREAPQRSGRSKGRVDDERVEAESTLHRLQARGERLLQWFPELRKTWQQDAEPALHALIGQVQTIGGQVSRRAQETGWDLEQRAERVLADLERQAVRGLSPILSRANLASVTEVSDLEHRLIELEARFEPLLESRTQLAAGLAEMQTTLEEARADVTERFRETTVRLSAFDEIHSDLGRVHGHLDALSKEQVTRSFDLGKLQDRMVRLELRMGDILKEQAAQGASQQDALRRIGALDESRAESTQIAQAVRQQAATATAEIRATDSRLTTVVAARNADHDEITRIGDVLGSIQHTLRQVDLRLGDLGERYTGLREEIANLSLRVSNLELAPSRPAGPNTLTGRTEGH